MNRSLLAGTIVIAAVAASSLVAYRIGRSRPTAVLPRAHADPQPEPTAAPAPAQSAPSGMRARVREAIEQAPVRRPADLARFLDSLEARTRAQGAVTALEVEPGIALIQRYSEDPEQIVQFSERMQRLQEELTRHAPAVGDAGAGASLDELSERMARPRDDTEKRALLREYLERAAELPGDAQDRAHERLNAAHGVRDSDPDVAALDTLYRAIETTNDEPARRI